MDFRSLPLTTPLSSRNKRLASNPTATQSVASLLNLKKKSPPPSARNSPSGCPPAPLPITWPCGCWPVRSARVLVQAEAHLFNDCGDCCQTLSGLHLVPLAPGQATFTLAQVAAEAERATSGRVTVPIGAIQIETPVRRKSGEAFDYEEMKRISAWARDRRIGLHLDGARLFLASAYSGIPVTDYARLFDTVYVSMYKYFNAASGAILAGPRALLENLFHARRMFGGGLSHVWPFAAVAGACFDGFPDRYSQAVKTSEQVIAELKQDSRFEIDRIANGTNIFGLRLMQGDAKRFQERLRGAGVVVPDPVNGRFLLSVNETWNRVPARAISHAFRNA